MMEFSNRKYEMDAWFDKFELYIPNKNGEDSFICSKLFGLEPSEIEFPYNQNPSDFFYMFVGLVNSIKDINHNTENRRSGVLNITEALPLNGKRLLLTVLYEGELYEMSCSYLSTIDIEDNNPIYYSCNKTKDELTSIFNRAIANCSPYHKYIKSSEPIILSVERLRDNNYIPMYRKMNDVRNYSFSHYYGKYEQCKPASLLTYHGLICELSKKILLFYTKESLSKPKYDKEGFKYQDHDTYYYVGELFFPTVHDMYKNIGKAQNSGLCKIAMSNIDRNKSKAFDNIRKDFKSKDYSYNSNSSYLPKLTLSLNNGIFGQSSEKWSTIGNNYSISNFCKTIKVDMINESSSILDVFPNMHWYFDSWYYDEILV